MGSGIGKGHQPNKLRDGSRVRYPRITSISALKKPFFFSDKRSLLSTFFVSVYVSSIYLWLFLVTFYIFTKKSSKRRRHVYTRLLYN